MIYFKDFWNYIDLTPIMGIYVILIISAIETIIFKDVVEERVDEGIQRVIISITTLFMWLKFLYFLRLF